MEIVKAVNEILAQYNYKLTVRQIYYRLISPPYQLFPNDKSSYNSYDRILTRAREKGEIDWHLIEDRVRSVLGGDGGYESVKEYMEMKISTFSNNNYTKRMWANQPKYVEVWVEKDALATLFTRVANKYNVITFPSRGYSSFTKVMEAIERFDNVVMNDGDKRIVILHFTDHDPSGLDMTEDLDRRFNLYCRYGAHNRPMIERVSLSYQQVQQYELAPNPVKRADKRAEKYTSQFGNECWELDALPPDVLENIIEVAIRSKINIKLWNERVNEIEMERKSIDRWIKKSMEKLSVRGKKE